MKTPRVAYPVTDLDKPLTYLLLFCAGLTAVGMAATLLSVVVSLFVADPSEGVVGGFVELAFRLGWYVRWFSPLPVLLLFALWQRQARQNLVGLLVRDLENGPVFPAVAWLIPIVGWFVPYWAVNEIWRASEPSVGAGGDWRAAAPAAPTKVWWTMRVGAPLSLPLVVLVMQMGSLDAGPRAFGLMWLVAASLWLAFLMLTLRLVREIVERQAKRYERLRADRAQPTPHGAREPEPAGS